MKIWLIMICGGILTFLIRFSFIALFRRLQMPAIMRHSLQFIPPAVLSAIIFPELMVRSGQIDLSAGNPRLIAGLLAAVVAWRTRSPLLTIVIGMGILLALQMLLGN